MAEYSKEWIEKNKLNFPYDFSIEDVFQNLKEGKSKSVICEGFGITNVVDIDEECFVQKDGKIISFETLSGIRYEKKDNYWPLIWLFLIILGLWFLSWGLIIWLIPAVSGMTRGTFGDMFGSVNSLFSGLALGGIIFTIFLQKKELKLQRKELRETRNEFSMQNDTLKKQRFENTFFQMISLHHEIIDKFITETIKFEDKKKRDLNLTLKEKC